MRRLPSLLVGLCLAAPLYLLLIDTFDTPELIAGAVSVVLAALMYEIAQPERFETAVFTRGFVGQVSRACAQIPKGVARVSYEIVLQAVRPKARRGRVCIEAYDAGGSSDHDAGKRAMTEALGSLAPDAFVIGIDRDRDQVLVHRFG